MSRLIRILMGSSCNTMVWLLKDISWWCDRDESSVLFLQVSCITHTNTSRAHNTCTYYWRHFGSE